MIFCLAPFTLLSQEEEEKTNKLKQFYEENKPVRPEFEGGMLIDGQSTFIPTNKTLEFMIQHRFGSMENGLSDLFGIYGTANTRLGLNYSITDWLQVGYGLSKYRMVSDFSAKLQLVKQTRNNKIPVAVALYGNFGIDGRNEQAFGQDYAFTNRFSYFSELLISRKFNMWLTVQAGVSFTHFNAVDLGYEHDKIGVHFLARARFSPQSSIIVNYDWPLIIEGIAENLPIKDPPKPNLGIGYEVSTSTHVFQIFVGTTTMLAPQYVMMENQNDWTKGDFFIGFNINRIWTF